MCDYGVFGSNASDRGFSPYEVRREIEREEQAVRDERAARGREMERLRAKVAALEALEAAETAAAKFR